MLNTAIGEGDWIEKYKMISEKLSEQFNIDMIGTEIVKTMEELNSQVKPEEIQLFSNFKNFTQTKNFRLFQTLKSLQTTILNLMKMTESGPSG